MKAFPVRLVCSGQTQREPLAWFVAGSDSRAWLETISDWNVPLEKMRFYVVPGEGTAAAPLGALVIPQGATVTSPGRAIPYGRLAERLYIPVDAELFPPLSEKELAALLPSDLEACLWNPVVGLVGFDPGEGVPFSQFLECPPSRLADWNRAHPGIPINGRLRTVRPRDVPDLMQVFEEGRGDIGSHAGELAGLPPTEDETSPGLPKKFWAGLSALLARIGIYLLNKLPQTADSPTWADRAQQWLMDKLRSSTAVFDLISQRERELRRLINLLETDPEQGLQFALPLASFLRNLGSALPGGQLVPHSTDFNLGRLGGSGPADVWDIADETRLELQQQYRRLAAREMQLGRHRRAAYIFAELVGDLDLAAGALVAGSHFREAACLYKDRLKQPLEAARCLERGGLWAEALELYEELGQFEPAGDLARKLDQTEDAERLYRRAVAEMQKAGGAVEAAGLLEKKLNAPDEALQLLLDAWEGPLTTFRKAVGPTFRLVGRLSRHELAARLVENLADSKTITASRHSRVEEIVEVATSYPDAAVRHAAADAARIQMTRVLTEERRLRTQGAMAWIPECLRRLAPEDRLIVRDAQRFIERNPPRKPPVQKPQADSARRDPSGRRRLLEARLIADFRLPIRGKCVAAASDNEAVYVAAYTDDSLVVLRLGWFPFGEDVRRVEWRIAAGYIMTPVMLLADPVFDGRHTVVGRFYQLSERTFPGSADEGASIRIGTPAWGGTGRMLGVARSENFTCVLHLNIDLTLQLWMYTLDDQLLSMRDLSADPAFKQILESNTSMARMGNLFPMQTHGSNIYFALGSHLVIVRATGKIESTLMPGPIRQLTCSAPHTRTRIAVAMDRGGVLIWDDFDGLHENPYGQSLETPVVGFTRNGYLVAASESDCRIYSTRDRQACFETGIELKLGQPVAVLPTEDAKEFVLCFANGQVRQYRIAE